MSFLSYLKFGLRGLWHNPVRLFFTVCFCVVTFAVLGLSTTLALFNTGDTAGESLLQDEVCAFEAGNGGALTPELKEELSASVGKTFLPMLRYSACPDLPNFSGDCTVGRAFRWAQKQCPFYCTVGDETILEQAGATIYGRLPSGKNEVAVGVCVAYAFVYTGYYDNIAFPVHVEAAYDDAGHYLGETEVRDGEWKEIGSVQEVVGLGVTMLGDNEELVEGTIVGVVDIPCEKSHYGTYSENAITYSFKEKLFVSEEYFRSKTEVVGYYCDALVSIGAQNKAEAKRICAADATDEFSCASQTIQTIQSKLTTLNEYRNLAFWGTLVLILFSATMIYQFISLSVEKKRKEVGILRALGATSANVAFLYTMESILFGFLVGLLGCIAMNIALPYLNYAINGINATITEETVILNYVFPRPQAHLCVFGVSIGVSLLSSAIPILREAKKTPVDTMRDNEE